MHRRKLDGVRRFARPQGWDVATLAPAVSTPTSVRALLARRNPAGCIVDLSGAAEDLPPSLFGEVPVVYLDVQEPFVQRPYSVLCDNAAVAEAAFRELSAAMPPSYAVVPYLFPRVWSDERVEAFAALCRKSGKDCEIFPKRGGESREARVGRLAAWAAALPLHCAVIAVNGPTAEDAERAFAEAHRPMPRTPTLVGVDGFYPVNTDEPQPSVSSVQVDFELAGFLAARMLAGRIPGGVATAMSAAFGPLLCIRRESTRGRGRRAPFVMEAAEMIRHEACDGLVASALAARFPCSRNLFERRFREAMGRSVLDEILHVRMERALQLLARPEIPVGAIPDYCGFGSAISLMKHFKTRFGVSMREWRSKHGQ